MAGLGWELELGGWEREEEEERQERGGRWDGMTSPFSARRVE